MWSCRVVDAVRAYVVIVAMWIRSATAYRASFVMLTAGSFVVTGLDFVLIWIMFTHVSALGGYRLPEIAFLYGASGLSLGIVDLVIGSVDRLGARVRDGTLDVMLVRPVPAIVQVAADQFALRRLGRVGQAGAVFGWALRNVGVHWSIGRIVMVPAMIGCGAAIFGAIFVLGASYQFLAADASEVMNSFTYGGNTLTQYPPTIFGKDLVRVVTFGVPIAFVNWVPAAYILNKPVGLGLPGFTSFLTPLAGLAMIALACLGWRAGIRGYRSTGS